MQTHERAVKNCLTTHKLIYYLNEEATFPVFPDLALPIQEICFEHLEFRAISDFMSEYSTITFISSYL